MVTAIIDYGSGNLRSAAKAFERAAAERASGEAIAVTSRPEGLPLPTASCCPESAPSPTAAAALPPARTGGGAARGGHRARAAVSRNLRRHAAHGACGREFETVEGLGWIAGEVVAIAPADPSLKIPHMGWNELRPPVSAVRRIRCWPGSGRARTPISSTATICGRPIPLDLLAITDYGGELAAVVGRDNLIGTQFHPEKSQAAGLRLIANFLRWRP